MDIKNLTRTIVFDVALFLSTVVLAFSLLPSLFSKKIAKSCAMTWVRTIFVLSKYIAKVDFKIIDEDVFLSRKNNAKGIIVTCNHCSAWETFFISNYFKTPIFILKKSLFLIPIVGNFLKILGMIGIDRNSYNKESRQIIVNTTQKMLNIGRNIAIFPQGTRVPISETFNYEKYPFKSGVAIFAGGNSVLTVSTNAREFFGKGLFSFKKSGTIYIKFNEIINFQTESTKQEIIQTIQKSIEKGCRSL